MRFSSLAGRCPGRATTRAVRPSLWLVDGSHAVYRAFNAIRVQDPADILRAPDGRPTNAVHVFTSMLLKELREHRPTHLLVAFDEDAEASRKAIYPGYKASRPDTPDLLKPQFPMVGQVIDALGLTRLSFRGYEADDIIATLCKRARAQGMDVVILSGDKDLLQLVEAPQEPGGAQVRCYDSMLGKWYSPPEVEEKWGVGPAQVADLLALTGDKIDDIPGVPGVGEKTAAGLLKEHGTLEAVLLAAPGIKKPKLRENLVKSIDDVRRGRRLIALFDDLPLPLGPEALALRPFDETKVKALFKELGFNRLLGQLPRPEPKPPEGEQRVLGSARELEEALARARASGRIGLLTQTSLGEPLKDELVGVALALPPQEGRQALAVYVPLNVGEPAPSSGDLFAAPAAHGLGRQAALHLLRGLLEDAGVVKDGHDLKGQLVAWRRAGIELRGLGTDARLASYLLDPTEKEHALVPAAKERCALLLGEVQALVERSGKGKKATPVDKLSPAELGPLLCAHAEAARQLALAHRGDLAQEPALEKLYDTIEKPLSVLLAGLELRGILLDTGKLAEISQELAGQIDGLLAEILQLAGTDFSPASNQQLAEVLYDRLGLPVLKRGKTGPSTDQEVLEKLAEQHPLPAKLLEHRQLTKLRSTYLEALPAAVGKDGRLHTTFDQAVAATGRLSSVNPNLQNIPIRTKTGARIREAFVAGAGMRLISADYSQIELRILAHVSQDPVLIESFRTGEDLHARTAAETFGVAPEQISKEQRSIAKMINYGIAYGLSGFGLGQRLGLPTDEANAIIARYFERYQGVSAWLDRIVAETRKEGVVGTLFGRRRFIPDIGSRNPALRMAAERTAVNTPIQGTAADLVKVAMLRVDVALKKERSGASMLLQIHDELLLEAPAQEAEATLRLVRGEMEQAAQLLVPLVVDAREGATWAAAH
jgi:DNA polymerase I